MPMATLSDLFLAGGHAVRQLRLFDLCTGRLSEIGARELDVDFLKKVVGRSPAGKDLHKIVCDLLKAIFNLQHDTARLELDRSGIEPYFDLSRPHAVLDTLCIALFNSAERLLPIR